jgi:hypothetical protein
MDVHTLQITVRLRPHKHTKCVHCNTLCDVWQLWYTWKHVLKGDSLISLLWIQLPDVTKCVTSDVFCALMRPQPNAERTKSSTSSPGSWHSSVSIMTGYELDGCGLNPGRGKILLFSTMSRLALKPTQLCIQCVLGLVPQETWPRHKAAHSPPSSTEVKNGGTVRPFPICLRGSA